tara:strand:+ start:193 stop:708 length:516 start_codon:yes stop_codon:yes gene_type:complete
MAYQKLQVGRATDMDRLKNNVEDCVNLNDVLFTFTSASGTSGSNPQKVVGPANTFVDADGNNLVEVGDLLRNETSAASLASRIVAIIGNDTVIVQTVGTFANSQNVTVLKGSDEPAVLYVGTAAAGATLKVRSAGGDDATFVNIQQGSFIPVQVKRVYNTGTTATNIVALF